VRSATGARLRGVSEEGAISDTQGAGAEAMRASIVVPILYGEPQLEETLSGLRPLRDVLPIEILLVVDVPDAAREPAVRAAHDRLAVDHGARVVYRVGERGFGSALRRGFAESIGDPVIPMMADASEDPLDVVGLIRAVEEGWDVVSGSRYMRGGGIVGWTSKQRISRAYSRACRVVGGPPVHDVSNAFKAYRRAVVESVHSVAESFDISVELTVKAHLAGFRVTEIPTVWTNRREGASSFAMRNELPRYGRWLWLAGTGKRSRRRAAAPDPLRAPGGGRA
jgi:dolichol-phosphate mannosyltransferase